MDHPEFGKYLAQQRELRGMSREEVTTRTKIPPSILVALENGERERLPDRVFVLNYIRSYAAAIGLSPEEAVLRYEEIYTDTSTVVTPVELERRRRRHAFRVLLILVLVVGGAVGAFVFLKRSGVL